MKVKEFIEWLKTQDQDLTVNVMTCSGDWGFDGENEYYQSYNYKQEFNPDNHAEISLRDKTLFLGGEE